MASKVNYLIINKQGTCYHKQDTAFVNVLKWYIKNYVGFNSGCKIDETSWSTISANIPASSGSTQNYSRINFFNSICTKSGFQVKKVVYNHTVLYPAPETPEELPAEITSFFIVTDGGKYFSYAATTLSDALKHAAESFVETRIREGENLKNDLIGKLDNMLSLVDFIETRSPKVLEEYRRKLEDKVKDMLQSTTIDESRILTEVTIFADKICVDEETVRLRSHIEGMKKELLKGGAIGRKLDFIAQEMNRESNTILSKSNDMEISDQAIILKTEIEKVREQIQNIE